MTLNLKDPRARVIVERLVADYDILIEQFRPGVMAKQIGHPAGIMGEIGYGKDEIDEFEKTGPFS